MPTTSRSRLAHLCLAAAGVLATVLIGAARATPADAASLVYLDQNYNVWITSPDGARRKQVTTDGTTSQRYTAPTADDAGEILTYGRPDKWWARIIDQNGKDVRGPWLLPHPTCSIGTLGSDITADGKLIAATWFDAGVSIDSCLKPGQPTTSILFGDVPTINAHNGAAALPSFDNKLSARWVYRPTQRLAGLESDSIWVQDMEAQPTPGQMASWIGVPPSTADLDSFDVSRAADRVLVESSADGYPPDGEQRDLELLSFTGAPPNAPVTHICSVDALVAKSVQTAQPRWSPDGTMISWSAPDGVYVSPAPVPGTGDQCVIHPTLIAPGGVSASWTKADVTVPPAPIPPAPPAAPAGGQTPSTSQQTISAPKLTGATLATGIALGLDLASPGTLSVKVERLPAAGRKGKAKLLGTVRFTGKAGRNALRIKRVGGRRLAKGRYRLTISAPGATPKIVVVTLRR